MATLILASGIIMIDACESKAPRSMQGLAGKPLLRSCRSLHQKVLVAGKVRPRTQLSHVRKHSDRAMTMPTACQNGGSSWTLIPRNHIHALACKQQRSGCQRADANYG